MTLQTQKPLLCALLKQPHKVNICTKAHAACAQTRTWQSTESLQTYENEASKRGGSRKSVPPIMYGLSEVENAAGSLACIVTGKYAAADLAENLMSLRPHSGIGSNGHTASATCTSPSENDSVVRKYLCQAGNGHACIPADSKTSRTADSTRKTGLWWCRPRCRILPRHTWTPRMLYKAAD